MTDHARGPVSRLDTTTANSARLWNYLLGGKDHFVIDRSAGDKLLAVLPELASSARETRAFLGRAVRHLVGEGGVRQFLDIGTGLPTAYNTHEVAQSIAPESRVVYVDNDPMVLAHARVLLTSTAEGRADYLEADLRDIDEILGLAAETLDFGEPVAVVLLGVLNFLTDSEAADVMKGIVDALSSGSYVVIAHPTREVNPTALDRAVELWNDYGCTPMTVRSPEAIAGFFAGLDVLAPGVVSCSHWRPQQVGSPAVIDYAGVGRKP